MAQVHVMVRRCFWDGFVGHAFLSVLLCEASRTLSGNSVFCDSYFGDTCNEVQGLLPGSLASLLNCFCGDWS